MSVGGNLRRTSVGRNLGKTSAVSFELTNYLICDAPSPLVVADVRKDDSHCDSLKVNREEEEEDDGGGE